MKNIFTSIKKTGIVSVCFLSSLLSGYSQRIIVSPIIPGGGSSGSLTGAYTFASPLSESAGAVSLPVEIAALKTNPPIQWGTNTLWGNFFKYDTNVAEYIVSASVTNEPARERLDYFVRQIKRAGLWSTMLDAASMFRYHQDSATTFKTLKGYAISPVNATQTLDDNGVLLDGTPTAAPMFHVPNSTNYTLVVAFRSFTNMAVAQSQLIGIYNTNGYTHGYANIETTGDNFYYLAMAQSNTLNFTNFSYALTTNAPALHHQDSMRHSAAYWVNGLTGTKQWADGLYSRSNVFANPPTNINMTELILGGYNNAAGSYPDGSFRGYIESWALFDGQLTDEQVKNVDMALRGLAPQRVNFVVEGTSLDAWNGIGFAGDVFWNWPFQLWQNPSVSNSYVFYNHAQAGARLITPTGGFGSMLEEYTNTIQYLRPEKNGGAYGVEKSILVVGSPANDFVDGITAANIYASYLRYIDRATADGFEVWAQTCGAAQFMVSAQNDRRIDFNNRLLTNSGMAKRILRWDLLFPEYMTNGASYYDGTHLSVTGNVEKARHILNLEGNRFAGFLKTNGVTVGPVEELDITNGGNLTISATYDPDLKRTRLSLAGNAGGSGGTNFPNINLLGQGTNLAGVVGIRYSALMVTNGNFTINILPAVPVSGQIVDLSVSNSASTTIIGTIYTNSVAANVYDVGSMTNVNTFACAPSAITKVRFTYTAGGLWELSGMQGPVRTLKFGSGITSVTNGANNLDVTISASSASVSFTETNIVVSTTNEIVIDVAAFSLARVSLLTNLNRITYSNAATMGRRAQIYFQQDTNGQRLISLNNVAGGIIQTNANLQPTTNANALDMLELMPGFHNTNIIAWWPQNFQSRVAFTNSLDDGVLDCSAASQSFLTINGVTASAADYYGTAFVSDGQDICKVELNIAKAADETSDYFVEMRSNSATNTPSQIILGTSASVLASAIGTGTNYVLFAFPSTISTANLSTNWFVLRKVSSTAKSMSMGRASGSVNLMSASTDGIAWGSVSTTRQGNYRTFKP